MSVPLKLDITTGDIITPKEIQFNYQTMFDEKTISVLAYNLETVLAEKLEAIFSRGDQTTRPRDYYDVYILWKLQGENVTIEYLSSALIATARKRNTLEIMKKYKSIIEIVRNSDFMLDQWKKYQRSFDYARGIELGETCEAVLEVMKQLCYSKT